MKINIITIFPGLFTPFIGESLLGRAGDSGRVEITVHNLREWTTDRHQVVDDTPFGGGGGMVLMAEPLVKAVESLRAVSPAAEVVIPTARGPRFDQDAADRLAAKPELIFVCGHYKGIDERVFDLLDPLRFSLGDYVLTGGELPTMVLIDAIVRRIPGFIGNAESAADDSFAKVPESSDHALLGPPVYTRPADFRGRGVPDVLISGDHGRVDKWREDQALASTKRFRPDLLVGRMKAESN